MSSQWTRNQKIAVWAIIIPAVIAIIALFIQVHDLQNKIQPVIEMKPQIINVNNNITRVEKEIANLHDVLEQEDRLKIEEDFTKDDLDIRFKKITVPVEFRTDKLKGVLLFELKRIPFINSISISRQDGVFTSGVIPSSEFSIINNVVMMASINTPEHAIEGETSRYTISYLPDTQTTKKVITINGVSCKYPLGVVNCRFHSQIQQFNRAH